VERDYPREDLDERFRLIAEYLQCKTERNIRFCYPCARSVPKFDVMVHEYIKKTDLEWFENNVDFEDSGCWCTQCKTALFVVCCIPKHCWNCCNGCICINNQFSGLHTRFRIKNTKCGLCCERNGNFLITCCHAVYCLFCLSTWFGVQDFCPSCNKKHIKRC
jgi:hypothetical protein